MPCRILVRFLNPCITITFLFFFFFFKSQDLRATTEATLLLRCTSGLSLPAYSTIEGEDKSDNNLGMWR